MTLKELALGLGKNPETVGKLLNRNGLPVERGQPLTPTQVSFVRQKYGEAGKPDTLPGQVPDTLADTQPAPSGQKPDATKRAKPQVSGTAVRVSGRFYLYMSVLALCVSASALNLYDVSYQMKHAELPAVIVATLCSLAPALLIRAGGRDYVSYLAIGLCMTYTAYCNTAAVYYHLIGLDEGYLVRPTPFLEAASQFANSGDTGTARLLSLFFAANVALLEFAAVKGLSK